MSADGVAIVPGSAIPTIEAERVTELLPGEAAVGAARAEAAALSVGAVVNGRYTIRSAIARGGVGAVYNVSDALHPERRVALKVVPGIASNSVKLSMFKAEFATMTKLEHPNVARVYDFEQIRGSQDHLIAMEHIDGAPLACRPGDWRSAVDLIVQVCRALAYVHSRRITHFDLKPANILVDRGGTVKVVDFGIAGAEPFARDGFVMGTPLYMAPELLLGGGSGVDHRADLYALGITLYELLTGELPCAERSLAPLIAWLNRSRVQVGADIDAPAWLKQLVERLCAKDPADRPRSANAVIREINVAGGFHHPLETAETRQSYVMTPRFSGRAAELERSLAFVSRRLAGDGDKEALLLCGPSGIGKSRLMREVRQAAQLRRLAFLEGNCYEWSLVEYGAFADVLHQLVPLIETTGGDELVQAALPELVKLAPKLGDGRVYVEAPRAATAEGERARLYEAVTTFLLQAARRVPFAIYLNDLQWAARGTAQLFYLIAQRLRDEEGRGQAVNLALLGSYRSDEVEGRPLAETVRVLSEGKLAELLELAPLGASDVNDVITSMLGVEGVPADFLARVTKETAGNPFFVQEVMRVLFENGTVFLDPLGRWAANAEVGALDIPSSMAEVFRRRFVQLNAEEQKVVRTLAVHGRPLRLDLLAEVHGDVTVTMKAVANLQEKAIVEKQAGKALAFNIAHDRMRETIYADLGAPERVELHRGLAETLEASSLGLDEKQRPLDELARHFRGADLEDKALDYARRAGRRAIECYANDAAVEHLLFVKEVNHRRGAPEIEVVELLAEALLRRGNAPRAVEVLTRGLPLCRTGSERSRLRSKLARCRLAEGALTDSMDESKRALAELGMKVPRTRVGLLLAALRDFAWFMLMKKLEKGSRTVDERCRQICSCYSYLLAGHGLESSAPLLLLHATLRTAIFGERAGACQERAFARLLVGIVFIIVGYHKLAARWLKAAREEASACGYVEVLAGVGYAEFGTLLGQAGPSPEQLPELRTGVQQAKLAGSMLLGINLHCLHHETIRRGAWKAGIDAYRSVLLYIERFAPTFGQNDYVHLVAPLSLLHTTGSAVFAIELADACIERGRRRKDWVVEQCVSDASAEALAAAGDLRGAISRLESSLRLAKPFRFQLMTREVYRLLPRLYLQERPSDKGARRRARRVIERGRRLIAKGHEDKRPLVELSEAILFEAQGKPEQADARFEQALRTARSQGTLFYVYDILMQRGLLLQKRGDAANGRRDLDEARALATSCGDLYVTRLCDKALGISSSPAPARAS
jgi:tetratricopeptide (TPR) repeat protein